MSNKSKKEIPFWAKLGHGKPVTRRDFLSTGMIPFAAYAVAPSISTLLLPRSAMAANCEAGAATRYIPFITLNLSGGPSLAGNVVVKTMAGEMLSSYSKLGLGSGPARSFNVIQEFGNVDFPGTAITGNVQGLVSKFLTGMRNPRNQQNFRNAALDKSAFVWSAVALGDDTSANKLDVSGLVLKMGLAGSKLPNLGRADTATGISQQPTLLPPASPFVVGRVTDLVNALGYTNAITNLSDNQKNALARTIASLSGSQLRRIGETHNARVVTELAECAGIKNAELIETKGGDVNPFRTGSPHAAQIRAIWGIQDVNDMTSQNAVFSSMVYNGLIGNASTIALNLGGYDYHDSTRTTGDARDLAAGTIIGKILETAEYLNQPCFIYVCADGATVSAESATPDSIWVSDRGIAGMQYMISYDPAGRPITTSSQVGAFTHGQAADGSVPTGNSADLAAQAVFANYAALNGRRDFLEQYRVLSDDALRAKSIKFEKRS